MDIGGLFFYGLIAWVIFMATFRPKQLMELDDHVKGNQRDALRGMGKAAGVGMNVLGRFLKQ
jgi:hypothetical protein